LERDERLTLAAFLASAVLAGGNGVGIRISNRELDPLWGAGLRFSLAAVVFLVLMATLRLELPRGRVLAGSVLYGVLQFGATYALAYYALVELHAGFGQILLALVPLLTILLAVSERQERFRLAALLGAGVALAGVVVMSRAPLRESVPLVSVLAALGSGLCFAQAAILVRWLPRIDPVTTNAVGMTTGAFALVLAALARGETLAVPEEADTWLAIAYLVILGSVVVFALNLVVLGRWEASRYAYLFVLVPVVTVALSAWLDDEPVGEGLVVGGLLVLVGVYVGALRGQGAGTADP
jgi:drug/metabolite transporter (DMT)-like permease